MGEGRDSEQNFLGCSWYQRGTLVEYIQGNSPGTHGCGKSREKKGPGYKEWTSPGWACKVIKCSLPTLQMGKWWNREGTWSSLKVTWDVSATPGRLTASLYFNLAPSIHSFNNSFNHSFLYSFIHSVIHPFLHWLSPLFLSMSWPPCLTPIPSPFHLLSFVHLSILSFARIHHSFILTSIYPFHPLLIT